MCDEYDGYDDYEDYPDYDPYDFQLESSDSVSEEEDRKGSQPGEIFICVSESSLVPQTWTRRSVCFFLVRYVGFDHFYDDWVPASKLSPHLIDEYYCNKLGMSAPVSTEFPDRRNVPLTEKAIKRQLRALGCYRKPGNLRPAKSSKVSIKTPVKVDLLDILWERERSNCFMHV